VRKILLAGLVLLLGGVAEAAVKTQTITYTHDGTTMKGYLAWDDASKEKRPGVMVVHEWWGLDAYAKKRAEQLAGMGYVAFAADLYGKVWHGRALASLEQLRKNELVDGKRVAAIGYCFGGSTVLHLALTGADLAAVVSFHGALAIPEGELPKAKAKVLICHGAADPFIPAEAVNKFLAVLEKGKVDYQFVAYGGAVHSFSVPGAEDKKVEGIKYDAAADRRSWEHMKLLFAEAFGPAK
jgi:dienelactone hydrolase